MRVDGWFVAAQGGACILGDAVRYGVSVRVLRELRVELSTRLRASFNFCERFNGGRSPSLVHRALGVASRSAVCRALLCTRRPLHRPSQALRVLRA